MQRFIVKILRCIRCFFTCLFFFLFLFLLLTPSLFLLLSLQIVDQCEIDDNDNQRKKELRKKIERDRKSISCAQTSHAFTRFISVRAIYQRATWPRSFFLFPPPCLFFIVVSGDVVVILSSRFIGTTSVP
jgi:hypothetical protein